MTQETPEIITDEPVQNELDEIVKEQHRDVRREKFDLSSTRTVIERLLKEGAVGLSDTVADLKEAVEREFAGIEDI